MGLTLEIAGASRAFEANSLRYQDSLNGRDTMAFRIVSDDDEFQPFEGATVRLLDQEGDGAVLLSSDGVAVLSSDGVAVHAGPDRLFGGIVQDVDAEQEGESDKVRYEVEAEDFSGLLDRRLVARVYENQFAGAILRDILERDVSGEGLSSTGIQDGPLISRAVLNYVPASEVAAELSELTGMAWGVTPDKGVHFRSRDSITGPAIGATGYVTLRVRTQREDYRNAQILRAGTALTDPRVETVAGDGTGRVFHTVFPVGAVPSAIEESRDGGAFAEKTIGIRGVETGRDWYWNKAATEISQDDAGTVLAAADRLRITYRGRFPIIVEASDADEIASRAALEGGSGIYQVREDRTDIDDLSMALETTLALLERFGTIGRTIDVTTLQRGFRAGQLVRVTVPRHNLDGEFLVTQVTGRDWLGQDQDGESKLLYQVTLVEGDPVIGWREFYRKLISAKREFVLRENEGEVLVLARTLAAPVTCTVTIDVDVQSPEDRIGFLEIGRGEIGA